MASSDGMRDQTGAPEIEGRVLDGRYRIESLVGSGGMGAVFSAVQVTLDKRVAIKVLRPEYARRDEAVKRFLREARAASKINHRNVVEVTDFGQTADGLVYFVMEFLEGADLSRLLAGAAPLAWPRAKGLLLQVARALKAAHANGIVHRDIKPANCFLVDTPDGEPDFVKVLDFGIAKVMEAQDQTSAGLTSTSQVMGTALYMAPEQAMGQTIDARTDVYSLGVMAFEMLTGQKPFTGATAFEVLMKRVAEPPPLAREVAPHLSGAVEVFLGRALTRDPVGRYQSMREFEAALSEISDARGQRKTAAPLPPRPGADAAEVAAETATSSRHRLTAPETDPDPTPTLAYQSRDLRRAGDAVRPSDAPTESGPALPLPTLPGKKLLVQSAAQVQSPRSGVEAVLGQAAQGEAPPQRGRRRGVVVLLVAVVAVVAVGLFAAAGYRFGFADRGRSPPQTAAARTPALPVAAPAFVRPDDMGDVDDPDPPTSTPPAAPARDLGVAAITGTAPLSPPDDAAPAQSARPKRRLATKGDRKPRPKVPRQMPKKATTDDAVLRKVASRARKMCGKHGSGSVNLRFFVEASGNDGMYSDVGSTAPPEAVSCVKKILRTAGFAAGKPRTLKLSTDL